MQITVTTRHGHLNDQTQERLTAKAEKLLRFFDRLTSIEVVVDLQDSSHPGVHINATLEQMHEFVSHAESENLLSAVESAVQKMEQQLKRHKDRLQHRHREAGAKRGNALPSEVNESAESADDDQE